MTYEAASDLQSATTKSVAPEVSSGGGRQWWIPAALGVTFFVHYLDRNLVSLALPAMAISHGWDDREVGRYGQWLLGAFFLTYGVAQMLLSAPAERWGPRRSLIAAVTGFSLVTLAMGTVGAAGGLLVLVALRALLGVAESVHAPMMSVIVAQRFGDDTRARANSIWNVGLLVATAVGPAFAVPLIATYGWSVAFTVIGAAGLCIALPTAIWAIPPDVVVSSRSPNETNWQFVRSTDYWIYAACGTANAFCGFGLLGWLPTYISRSKGVDFSEIGWPLSIVFATGVAATLIWAVIGDKVGRRLALAAAGLGASALALLAAQSAASTGALVIFFAIAIGAQSAFTAQQYATLQRLVRGRSVGAATGLHNGVVLIFGGVGGSLIPGAVVSATGSFDHGLVSAVVGTAVASFMCCVLFWRTRL